MRAYILATLALACGQAGAPAPVEGWSVLLSPEAALTPDTVAVAARWTAATGLPVTVGDGGLPVRDDELVPNDAMTRVFRGVALDILVREGEPVAPLLLREVGFVACIADGYDPACEAVERDIITAASLEVVCAHAPCVTFQPER